MDRVLQCLFIYLYYKWLKTRICNIDNPEKKISFRKKKKKASTGGLFPTVIFCKYYEIKTLLVSANVEIWTQLTLYTLLKIFKYFFFHYKNVSAFLWLVEMEALVQRGE